MTDQHPITIPAGSITCWRVLYQETCQGDFSETEYIANEAARWGADMELEACCEWLRSKDILEPAIDALRATRRPKPPSLKEKALKALKVLPTPEGQITLDITDLNTIRRALEALPND